MEKQSGQHTLIGPGEHIWEEIEAREWSEEEFADILGITTKHLSQILNDKKPMTIQMARLIGRALGTSAQVWMNLYINYIENTEALQKHQSAINDVDVKKLIYKIMPLNDMIKKGWIQKPGNNAEILSCVKKIWGTNSFEDILMEINSKPLPAFRKSERDGFSRNYSQTWLKIAENISDTIKAPKYNPVLFEGICARANEYTIKENGETEFIKDINKAGVKFFILPHLRKTFIDGAAFVHKNNPVIVYTARHDRMDNFWFTVLHEAGHVLKHLKVGSEGFIDDISIIEGEKEKEADRFSGKQLKINEILKMYEESFNGRVTWITAVSKELHISSAVIVGFLQKAGKLTYRSKVLSSIKNPISELFKKNYVADIPAICKFN